MITFFRQLDNPGWSAVSMAALVQHMASSTADAQIVQAIIQLAHNFNLSVVAEGAEDQFVLQMLIDMGCDQVQGYVFARPMPAVKLAEWMALRVSTTTQAV